MHVIIGPGLRALVSALVLAAPLLATGCAPGASGVRDAAPAAPMAIDCRAFADALRACAPALCRHPHLFAPSFAIEHRISGPEADACAYSQSMPGDMLMTCRYSEAGRSEAASLMDDMFSGRQTSFSFSTSEPQDNAMTRECVVRDRDGAVIPWGVSGP